ncbi:MAG: hypothetical protein KME50_16110 [Nostoc desertorum CM1-VF14]|nr:hypothetical protein [Nostoc desertorum CM1-VF14]
MKLLQQPVVKTFIWKLDYSLAMAQAPTVGDRKLMQTANEKLTLAVPVKPTSLIRFNLKSLVYTY